MSTSIQNQPEHSKDSSNNLTYAAAVLKGTVTQDASNNNPSIPDSGLGNDQLSNAVNDNQDRLSVDDCKTSGPTTACSSLYESFEDDEDSSRLLNGDSPSSRIQNDDQTNSETVNESAVSEPVLNSDKSSIVLDMNESSSAGENSDSTEDESADGRNLENLYPNALKWKFRSEVDPSSLPETCTVLKTDFGSTVYLVGTAHYSLESQEDVAKVIRAVQPDVVLIELCKSRVTILSLDEETLLEEGKNLNLQNIRKKIEADGLMQGVLYYLLLSMAVHLSKELGMAPGGEFRRAYQEAMHIPGCLVQMGDRPIHITLQRAFAKLSAWQKVRIAWHILRAKGPITKEEVERCKQKDLLEEILAQMAGEFPELSEVFLNERDVFLAYSLQRAALPILTIHNADAPTPSVVVGVVGIGHVSGIVQNWGKVKDEDIPPILCIPEPTLTSKIIRHTIRLSLCGLAVYCGYKLLPKAVLPSKGRLTAILPSIFRKQ